jgi:hypothetical protein
LFFCIYNKEEKEEEKKTKEKKLIVYFASTPMLLLIIFSLIRMLCSFVFFVFLRFQIEISVADR